jgi:hypothetical protein
MGQHYLDAIHPHWTRSCPGSTASTCTRGRLLFNDSARDQEAGVRKGPSTRRSLRENLPWRNDSGHERTRAVYNVSVHHVRAKT